MADKQIGIKLDVRQTGLQQVDDALETISKNLAEMNESVVKQQQKGWGSESQTKELRDQLRQMQQMTNLYERIARTQGRDSSSFGNFRSEMGGMSRDLNALPSYRTGGVGGFVQDRFGQNAAASMEKVLSTIGKIGAMYAGFSIGSTLHSGLARGDQLAFGYGDISKRMGNRGSAMSYAKDMTRGLDGYGFDDMSVMQSTAGYSSVTGRMNPSDLKSQMKTILSTGRRFGMSDPSAITSAFGDAFSSGVTGGSGAQMKPQEFADLLANAVSSGRMQGKEGKMLEQLTQVTQMSMQSMGNAGNEKTIAALLSMGNKTGNQALINNLPSMMSNIDQGISNPSGGYAGQALMMRAIGGGKMNFWDEQFLQSKGALGRETDSNGDEVGQTNIEKATSYLMKTFKGNKNRQYMMLGQMFNLKPAQAKQYIDTYTKDGKFDSDSLNQTQSQLGNNPSNIPQTDTDGYRADQQSLQTGADSSMGQGTTKVRSTIGGFFGDILKNPTVGTGIGIATGGAIIGAAGIKGLSALWGLRKLIGGAKIVGGATSAAGQVAAASAIPPILGANGLPLPPSTPPVAPPPTTSGGFLKGGVRSLIGKLAIPLAVGSSIYNVATSDNKPKAAVEEGSGLAGMWAGAEGGAALGAGVGAFFGGVGAVPGAAIGGIIGGAAGYFGGKWVGGKAYNAATSPSQDQAIYGPPNTSGTADDPSTTASAQSLVPVVVSTLVALQPYMGQLKGLLGTDSATKLSSLSSDALKNPQIGNAPLLPSSGNGGLQLASYNPSVKRVGGGSGRVSSGGSSGIGSSGNGYSTVGGGNVSVDSINQMLNGTSIEGHGQDFIDAASEYGINPSALVGIVRAEQSFKNPYGSNNLTGLTNDMGLGDGRMFGANDGQKLPGFKSVKDGLRAASKNLSNYAQNGKTSIDDVAKTWVGNNNWTNEADTIKKTMDQLGTHPAIPTDSLKTASLNGGNLKVDGGSITVHIKNDNGTTQIAKAPITAQFTGLQGA